MRATKADAPLTPRIDFGAPAPKAPRVNAEAYREAVDPFQSPDQGAPASLAQPQGLQGPTIQELREQKLKLEREIEERRASDKGEVLAQIKVVMADYGVTATELLAYLGEKVHRVLPKPEQKYQDPVSLETWSGRGKEPAWIKGKDRSQFLRTQPQAG